MKHRYLLTNLKKVFFTLLWSLAMFGLGWSQAGTIVTGQVVSGEGEPLIGSTVLEVGTTNGTVTDLDGNYSITLTGEDASLIFSYVGYQSITLPVGGQSKIDATLEASAEMLDEVVVIGYGTQSRRNVTSAISNLSSDEIEDVPVARVESAIQGKISGVRVYHADGGQPGGDPAIRVRGGSSINRSNAPLYLVDGVQRSLADVNPGDIESIEVLKDASATAIYGSRASNGVVMITTKNGRLGQAEINFEMTMGSASPWKTHDFVDARTFIEYGRPAVVRSRRNNNNRLIDGVHPLGTGNGPTSPWSLRILEPGEPVPEGHQSMPDPLDPSVTLIFEDNNFQDVAFRTALEQNYYLSALGGTESIKYFASMGWTDHEGAAISTEYQRFSARSNVDFALSKNLELQTRFGISRSLNDGFDLLGEQRLVFARSIWLAPTARIYLPDGSLAPGNNATYTNPAFYADVRQGQRHEQRTTVGGALIWKPVEGLSLQGNADLLNRNSNTETFLKANVYDASRPVTFAQLNLVRWQFEGVASYNKTINGAHDLGLMVGASTLQTEVLDASSEGFGGATDNIQTMNTAAEITEATTFRSDETLNGLFGRFNYSFDDKYLVSASLRRDGSSLLAEDKRIGYFPSFSVGWVLSEEKFAQDISFLDFLKLRGSWGQTGNNDVSINAAAGLYEVGRNYNFQAGAFPSVIPNSNLGWETTDQWNVGMDVNVLDHRVRLLLDVYSRTTNDLIFITPLPNTSGFENITKNIGKVRFNGWEFELHTVNINTGDFRWESDFTYSYNMNEVLELPDNGRPQNRIGGIINPLTGEGVGGIAEGERLFSIVGYQNDFIIDNQEQANNAHYDTEAQGYDPTDGSRQRGRKFPGDMEWVDFDGNDTIDIRDQVVLGYGVPHTTGGFRNTFHYKGFELGVFMDFALGHSINDQVIRRGDANAIGGAARPTPNILRSWEEEGDIASGRKDFPRFEHHDAQHQRNIHRGGTPVSASVYKGDYLCIREVRFGYTFPQSLTERLKLRSASVFVAGQNLHYFTDYPGFVPEYTDGNNYEENTYPLPRKIIFGVKFGF